jgi:hypothetical protein
MRAAILGLLLCVALAGCDLLATEDTSRIEMDRGDRIVTVTVVDEAGLVVEVLAETPEPPRGAVVDVGQPLAWNPPGQLNRVAVRWASSSCSDRPVLRLAGNALSLEIDEGPLPEACDASLASNGVTLRLNRVVDATAIDVRMATP